jgi:hypothetical protein
LTAQDALALALKEVVAPVCREAGFRGSGKNWRRRNEVGDVAVVNVQSSWYSSAATARCIVNLSLVPEPWLDWQTSSMGRTPPRTVGESWGLYRDRLDASHGPEGVETWWEVHDEDDAQAAAHDMAGQLRERGLPRLVTLLDRDELLGALRGGRLGPLLGEGFEALAELAETVLLVDTLTPADLQAAQERLGEQWSADGRDYVEQLVPWAARRRTR